MQPNYQPEQKNAPVVDPAYQTPASSEAPVGATSVFGRIIEYIMLFIAIIATGSLLSGNVIVLQFTLVFFAVVAGVYIAQSSNKNKPAAPLADPSANPVSNQSAAPVPRKKMPLLAKILIGILIAIYAVILGYVGLIILFIIAVASSGV